MLTERGLPSSPKRMPVNYGPDNTRMQQYNDTLRTQTKQDPLIQEEKIYPDKNHEQEFDSATPSK